MRERRGGPDGADCQHLERWGMAMSASCGVLPASNIWRLVGIGIYDMRWKSSKNGLKSRNFDVGLRRTLDDDDDDDDDEDDEGVIDDDYFTLHPYRRDLDELAVTHRDVAQEVSYE